MKMGSYRVISKPCAKRATPSIEERESVYLRILSAVLLALFFAGCNGDDTTIITQDLPPQNVSISCMGKFAEPNCSGTLNKKCPAGCPEIACDAECLARECEGIDLLCPCDGSECFDPNPLPDPEPDPEPDPDPLPGP